MVPSMPARLAYNPGLSDEDVPPVKPDAARDLDEENTVQKAVFGNLFLNVDKKTAM